MKYSSDLGISYSQLMFQILSFVSLIFLCQGMVCKNDTDCGADECCYIQPEFMVVSKRDVPLVLPAQVHSHHDTGI